MFCKTKSYPGQEPPSYNMKAVTKRNKAMIRPQRDSNPGPLGQKSNALTTEPKSRLPDAVVRDWLYTQKLCMTCFMQIFVKNTKTLINCLATTQLSASLFLQKAG